MQVVKDAGGADVALEMVGGDQVAKDLSVMKSLGRVVMIAFPAGAKGEVDFNAILRGRLTLTGSTLRGRAADEKARLAAQVETHVWPLVEFRRPQAGDRRGFPPGRGGQGPCAP